MAFTLVTSANGRFGKNEPKDAAQAVTKGQVLEWDVTAGELIPSSNTSTFNETNYVSLETITAPAALTRVMTFKVSENDQFIADTVNNSNSAHNGQRMILDATGLLANNTGTDSAVGVVRQTGVFGAAANKQILVEFVTK